MANYIYTGISVYLKAGDQSLSTLVNLSETIESLREPVTDINCSENMNNPDIVNQILALDESDDHVEHSEWFHGVDESVAPANTPEDRLNVQINSTGSQYYVYIPFASKRKNNTLTQLVLDELYKNKDQIIQLAMIIADESDDYSEITPKVLIKQ